MTHQFTKFSELWSALFDGHSLQCEGHTGSYYLFDGDIYLETHGRSRMLKGFNFRYPTLWGIVEEPKWDDPIPEGGIVCCVGWDNALEELDIIVEKTTAGSYIGVTGNHWGYAKPSLANRLWV
jgi:hypothetical protein